MNKAMWLGFFFFVAMVLLLFATLTVTKVRFGKPPKVKIDFVQVEGLRNGDPIRVDGVEVGKVNSIELRDQGVRVVGYLEEAIKIHDDYGVFVESFTVLGGNHISIHRGTPGRPILPDTTVLVGRPKLNGFEQIGRVLSENRDLIRDMLTSIKDTAIELRAMIQQIRTGEGTIPRLINDPAIFDGLMKTTKELHELAEKANKGTGTLGKLINDPSLYDELKGSLADIRSAAKSAQGFVDKAAASDGAFNKLMNDPKVAEDVEKMMENIRATSENLRQITDKIAKGEGTLGQLIQEDKLYDKADKVLESADAVLGRVGRTRVIVGGEYKPMVESETDLTRLYLRLQPDETKYFQGGVTFMSLFADGETIRFEKQVEEGEDDLKVLGELFASYRIPWFLDNRLWVRFGLIEGKPGGGLDFDLTLGEWPLRASFDIRDAYNSVEDEDIDENIRGPMTRAFLYAPLWAPDADEWWKQVLHGVKVMAGANRLQDDPEFFVGLGGELEDKDLRTLVVLLGLGQ